jgi:predicted glycosyltransferase
MQPLKIALRQRLIAAGVNGGNAIFDSLAPSGQAYPYLIVGYVGGGYESLTSTDQRNEVWLVKAITDQHSQAHELAQAIHAALHQQPLSVAGWQHLWTAQLDHLWRVENSARQQVYHAGGTFRIWLARA